MPFKSKSQVRRFELLVKEGKMSQAEFNKWKEETPNLGSLPERQHSKPKKIKRIKSL